MKTNSVKGTNDYLPQEVLLRDYMQNTILDIYKNNGFSRIQTPILEDIENLKKSEGGDNLNLIFEVMKRGDKLKKALDQGEYDDLADMGLRYDLTLPLTRYYANNRAHLLPPMKVIQIDKAYRAERPQKGRLREFVQCDIDILGDSSLNAEIELIQITAEALLAIGMEHFKIKLNDRRLLKSVLKTVGVSDDHMDSACVIFDKLDKIGVEGICAELLEKEFAPEVVDGFAGLLKSLPLTLDKIKEICPEAETVSDLEYVINTSRALADGKFEVVFDISLVRGQGYYTGIVFEVESLDFKGAIAGGGRYDNLIGKFVQEQVPAVGFSIGFERIFSILRDKEFSIPDRKPKLAYLYHDDAFVEAYKAASALRREYDVCLYAAPKKTGKFLNKLEAHGYNGFFIHNQSEEIRMFGE